jgi:FHA domain
MAKITFFIPDQKPAKYDLTGESEISIGRAADCSIRLDHGSVSGHHAVIRQIGAGLHVLIDNNSTNGIYLEGERVAEAPLANGASFMIGSVPAEYEGDDASVTHAQTPATTSSSKAAPATAAAGETHFNSVEATIAAVSARPAGFKDLSPVTRVVKKNTLGSVAMILGLVAILAAITLTVIAATVMSAG